MITTRIASQSDWPSIIDIYNQAVDDRQSTADLQHATVDSRREWLQQHSTERYPILVAETGERVIGWCSLSPWRSGRQALMATAEISYYIDNQHRGAGVASRLIEETIDRARQLGHKNLLAILLDINRPSIRLLEKFKFEKWGHLPNIVELDHQVCGQFLYGKAL